MSEEEVKKLEETINKTESAEELYYSTLRLSGICRQKYFSKINELLKNNQQNLALFQPHYDVLLGYLEHLNELTKEIEWHFPNSSYDYDTRQEHFRKLKGIALQLLSMAKI